MWRRRCLGARQLLVACEAVGGEHRARVEPPLLQGGGFLQQPHLRRGRRRCGSGAATQGWGPRAAGERGTVRWGGRGGEGGGGWRACESTTSSSATRSRGARVLTSAVTASRLSATRRSRSCAGQGAWLAEAAGCGLHAKAIPAATGVCRRSCVLARRLGFRRVLVRRRGLGGRRVARARRVTRRAGHEAGAAPRCRLRRLSRARAH